MTSSARDVVVGIDLGTTNSLLGVMIDGRPHVLPDDTGEDLLPSVVASDGAGGVLVGRAAKNRRLVDPAETVVSVKRAMGSSASFRVSGRSLSAAQVSALILGALLDRAEKKLGSRPTRAVITVPAFFDDAQRQATRDAGAIAGLTVERLVNEPTAAALTFQTGAEELVAVYDFGGGTFDVSVLERDEGLLEVRASRGDTKLGGDDLDAALTALVLARFGDKRAAIERDPRAMTRLVEAVERAKIALSDRDEARLVDPFLTGEGASAVHLDTLLTRAEVEAVAKPFLERTLRCIDDALRDAKAKPSDLHRVLLVGGSSKMPLVARMVAAHLGRPVHSELDADRAVAIGATLLGGRIGGVAVAEVLVDITPHTLAAGVLDASSDADDDGSDDLVAVPIIPRDTTVPVERKRTFYTMIEDQPGVDVPITQGEEHYTDDNTLLGSVRVEKLPSSPAGSPIDVVFRLDLSGVLTVRATHVASGTKAEVSIVDSPYRLTDQRRRESREEIEQLRAVGRAANDVASTGPSDTDLALAKAMLSRAGKAIVTKREATRDGDDAAILAKATGAADALRGAIETRASDLMERIDAVSDALLDLM